MEKLTIGQRITRLRKEKGLSLAELSQGAGIPASTLHYLEHGTREGGRLQIETAKRLALFFGVTLDYLCGMDDDRPLVPPGKATLVGTTLPGVDSAILVEIMAGV